MGRTGKHIVGILIALVFAMILANESMVTCRIYCKTWKWCAGCQEWLPEAPEKCIKNFSASS